MLSAYVFPTVLSIISCRLFS